MIYAIPILGWLIGLFFHVCLAIPFYYVWNWLAPIYFSWLPGEWKYIPFWNIVGLMVLFSILKAILLPSFTSTSTNNIKE